MIYAFNIGKNDKVFIPRNRYLYPFRYGYDPNAAETREVIETYIADHFDVEPKNDERWTEFD